MHLICKPFISRKGKGPGELRLAYLKQDPAKYYIIKCRLQNLTERESAESIVKKNSSLHLIEVVDPKLEEKKKQQPTRRFTAAPLFDDKSRSQELARNTMMAWYTSNFTAKVIPNKKARPSRGLGKKTIKAMKERERETKKASSKKTKSSQ